ncbi:MAG: MATE family efflux transporter [Solobacterium sp.]|nr:MATE family efflux transporter [Solobacterium sp.]
MSEAENRNIAVFEQMPVPKAVRTMVIPTIMGQLIILLYSIADTFFVGRTNNPLMVAGASLVLPVFNVCTALAGISGVGGGAQVSRLLGEKDPEGARRVSSFSLWFALLTGLVFALGVLLFMDPLMRLLGAKAEVLAYAKAYAMCVIVCGGIPTVMANVMANLLRSTGESRMASFGIMLGGLINIALDPLFMFVLFPKGMEIVGAGAATCVSNCISCIFFIFMIRSLGRDSVIRMYSPLLLPQADHLKKVFSIGIVSSVAGFLFDLDYMIIQRLMSGYGDIPVAAIGIVLKAERLPLNIGVGICQGMVPIIAYNYSAKNYRRMNDTVSYSRNLGIACALISILMYELFSPYIMRFFINEAQTVALGTDFLRARSLATVLMFLSFFHVHLFNSYGRGGEAFFLGVMRWLAFNIPMLFLLHHFFGMYGIVWSQLAADILTVALSAAVYRNYMVKHHMTA